MNKEGAIKYLPFVKALADGKVIQYKSMDGSWISIKTPGFTSNEYRIKPEPIEVWHMVKGDYVMGSGKETKELGERYLSELANDNPGMFKGYEIKLFRMVEDEFEDD